MENLVDRVDQDGAMTDFGRGKFEARVDFLRRGLRKGRRALGNFEYEEVMNGLQELIWSLKIKNWHYSQRGINVMPFLDDERHLALLEARAAHFGGLVVSGPNTVGFGAQDLMRESHAPVPGEVSFWVIPVMPSELGLWSHNGRVKFYDVMKKAQSFGLKFLTRLAAPQAICQYYFDSPTKISDRMLMASVLPDDLVNGNAEITFSVCRNTEPSKYRYTLDVYCEAVLRVRLDQPILFRKPDAGEE